VASRKQLIYCRLLYNGLIHLRMLCGCVNRASAEEIAGLQREFAIGWERANFLHNVHLSILEQEYVDNDITFINFAYPVYIEGLGDRLSPETAGLMLEFYEGVPAALRFQLSWHPSKEFRLLAAQGRANQALQM
jgi:hypothetical protein